MIQARQCNRCGSARTQVIAQSASPPGILVQCRDCGFSTLAALNGEAAPPTGTPSASDVDTRRIERLVNTVINEKRLPCQLQSVDRNSDGWRVAVRTRVGDFVKFEIASDSLSLMKAAIERVLAGM